MKEKIRRSLLIAMGSCFGVFIGTSLSRWMEYRKYPEIYAAASAPWYTSILVIGIFTAGIILVLGTVWLILGRKAENK